MTIRTNGQIIGGNIGEDLLSTKANINLDNSTAITNCITEIPQDIKLELSDGTLTLKAGSKVYVPNGFESDGTTKKFDVINITSDISTNYAGYPDYDNVFICLKTDGSFATYFKAGNQNSGTSGVAYSFVYRTDLNKIYDYEGDASNPYEQVSFPIGIFKYSNNGITSINQVFNGFGYIGSTVFALPGVKGLIPNGRNSDGTLKNASVSLTSVCTVSYTSTNTLYFGVTSDNHLYYQTKSIVSYDESTNTINWQTAIIAEAKITSGVISDFKPKTVFHALDYNDFKQADDNNVKLTGNQIIDGTKTFINTQIFKNTARPHYFYAPNIDTSTTPSSTQSYFSDFLDKNGVRIGVIGVQKDASGSERVYLQIGNEGSLDIRKNTQGVVSTYAPSSTAANSIVTHISRSLGSSGYFKLGNGLIIQWGFVSSRTISSNSEVSSTITFPTPFSSTGQAVTAMTSTGTYYASTQFGFSDITATSMKLHQYNTASGTTGSLSAKWIAVGY